jgi:hypothetical protein
MQSEPKRRNRRTEAVSVVIVNFQHVLATLAFVSSSEPCATFVEDGSTDGSQGDEELILRSGLAARRRPRPAAPARRRLQAVGRA